MKKKILILLALLMVLTVAFVSCHDDPVTPEDTTVADQPTEEPTQGEEDPTVAPDTDAETPAPDVTTAEPDESETPKPETPTKDPETPTKEPETEDPMEPVNVFEAADITTITGGDPNNLTQDCVSLEDGYLHIVPIGPDPYYYPFAGVDGARYVAIRYRTDATGANMQLYMASTGNGPSDDTSMIQQPIIADSEWHVIVFDTQSLIDAGIYDGKYVSYLRFDPLEAGYVLDENGEPYKDETDQWVRYTLPEGCTIDVAYIAFFHSTEAAAKYDFEQYPPFVEPSDAGRKNHSFDTFYVNNQMYFPEDGGASDKLDAIDNTLTFASASELKSIVLRGWIGFDQAIDSFGYYVDNYEFVYSPDFTKPTEDGVLAAGGEYASRFEIFVPLDYFDGDDHFVGFVVKLADGTVVRLRTEITIDLPDLPKDITDSFVSDVNANEIGTSVDASDLSNFFTMEMPTGGCAVEVNGDGKLYNMTVINDFYADVNGRYYVKANVIDSNGAGWMFARGYKVVNSDEIIEKADGTTTYKINNYYETDSAGALGGAGIYARLAAGKLFITVKYYNPDAVTRVGNKIYAIDAAGSELTIADNGSTVSILVDGVTYATVKLSGSITYGDINEVVPKNGFAANAVVTLKDGTTETIENTLIAETCECQVGVVARAGIFKFDMIAVGGYSAIEVPDLEITEPDNSEPADPDAPVYVISPDFLYEQSISTGGSTFNQHIASSEIVTDGEIKYVKLTVNGGDPYVTAINIGSALDLPQYMAIAYRTNSAAAGQFFIGSGSGWSGQGDMLTLHWKNDGSYQLAVVDLADCGITSIQGNLINYGRFDFFAGQGAEGDYFGIEYIAFFNSAEAAEKYFNTVHGIVTPDEPAGPIEHDYIADGLVALYDGSMNNRNGHDTTANVWQDLVGNNHMNVTIDENNYFTDNGLVVNSVKNYFPDAIVDTINGNAYTVEINMANLNVIGKDFATIMNALDDRFALFYRTSNGVLEFKFAGCAGDKRNIIQNALPMLQDAVITITYEVDGNSIIYINGELASTMPAQGPMEAKDLYFGHNEAAKQFEALFRSIRFYDRALTAEEVKHNADVDMEVEPALPTTPEEIVNAAYDLAEGATLEGTYTLTGVITAIDTAWSEQYSNISVWMQIGEMSDKQILAFRLAGEGASALKVGDTITVTGSLTNYYSKIEFAQGCTLDAVVPGEEPEPEEPAENAIIMDFADTTYRTEISTESQVFVNGALTVTNNKGASTSNVADYIGPVRFYKNSDVIISCVDMIKIEIACDTASYATALANSISDETVTVTTNGMIVTIEFAAPVESYKITLSSGQVRIDTITVYVATAEEPAANEINVTTTDTYGFFDEYTFNAPAAGTYTFTLPAGLGLYTAEDYANWGMPVIDFYDNAEGYTYSVALAADEEYKFLVGATTKGDWTITYTYVEGEVDGGDDDTDEPVAGDNTLTVGSNTITVTDAILAEGGVEYTLVVENAGQYTFSGDFMAQVFNGMGMMVGMGSAYLDPGTYTVNLGTFLLSNAGNYSLTVSYMDPNGGDEGGDDGDEPEVSGNPVIESLPFTYEITTGGQDTFDVYYDYTATEETTLIISKPEGALVSLSGNSNDWDTDENGNYVLVVNAGETVTLNFWTMFPTTVGSFTVSVAE